MNKYQIVYKTNNGRIGTEYVYAANRIAAFELFNDFGYEDVIAVDCVLVKDMI